MSLILSIIICILAGLLFLPILNDYCLLRKINQYHQLYAYLLVILALIHGFISNHSHAMISGKIAWMVLILMIILSKLLKNHKIHLFLSIIFLITVIIHIIQAIK